MDYNEIRRYAESMGFFVKYANEKGIGKFYIGNFKKKDKIIIVFRLQDVHKILKKYEKTKRFEII